MKKILLTICLIEKIKFKLFQILREIDVKFARKITTKFIKPLKMVEVSIFTKLFRYAGCTYVVALRKGFSKSTASCIRKEKFLGPIKFCLQGDIFTA